MPAPTKLTPKDKAEILRRRASGEGIQSIAKDFDVAHQTVSKVVKQDRERSELKSRRATTSHAIKAVPKGDQYVVRGSDLSKNAKPPFVFDNWAARDDYYERRRLVRIPESVLDSNDARRNRLTSDERRRGLIIRQAAAKQPER